MVDRPNISWSRRMPVAVTRRTLLSAAAACTTASFAVAQPALGPRPRAGEVRAGAGGTKVVLLGTKGGPRVNKGRANPSDHMLEVGPLIYNAWAGGLTEPIEVRGPPPIGKIVTNFLESVGYDIDIRMEDEGRPDLRKFVRVHEFEAPPLGAGAATAFERDGLRVSAVRVRHPPITHAYAYRFDAPDRSIVLSGDTTYSPELVALAKGADVLVHEAMHLAGLDRLLSRNPNAPTLRKHLVESHTTTEQLGHVAAEAGVKTLVLSHLVPGDDPSITAAMWTEDVRKNFSGEIVIGRDLMTI